MTDIRIGLVGAGNWGRNYVKNLAALGVLGAVCDASEERLAGVQELLSAGQASASSATGEGARATVKTTTNVEELAAMDNLAGVVIATPTEHHYKVAKTLLAAGKSCLVEKPLTDAPQTARELCELAEANNATLMVGHVLLYHPAVEALKGLLDSGALGDVWYVSAVRAKLGVIRRHENVMWSFAPHDISVVQYLLGEAPLSVRAVGASYVTPGIEDVTHLTLNFAGGRTASITSSWLDPERTSLIKVVGSKAMAVFNDNNKDAPLTLHAKGVDWEKHAAAAASSRLEDSGKVPPVQGPIPVRNGEGEPVPLEPGEALRKECEEFIRCIKDNRHGGPSHPPRSSGRQGLENVSILAKADESLKQGGATVEYS